MVDSRQKGARAETAARDILRKYTKLGWERTPGSGALHEKHKLKGDLYIPDCKNRFCVEVKHYKDDHLTSKLLTDKSPQILEWWNQADRQALQVDRIPLLLFKFDRSKWFVATDQVINFDNKYKTLEIYPESIAVTKLEDWLENEEIIWIL
jgi:hypothetical protein